MIWISALLVFGTLGLILANLGAQDGEPLLGLQQMIHARIPWVLLALLWAGCALGIGSVVRKRTWPKLAVLGLEGALTALVSWFVLSFGFLPPHELAVRAGDPFPAYALMDQEEVLHSVEASTLGEAALYIFYRGDW